MRRKLEEEVVQKFPYRCPYCDHPISYDQFNLRTGENEMKCPSCRKKYIKVVYDGASPSLLIKREGKRGFVKRRHQGK
jgi:ribosomal protein L37AE/L43A